MTNCVCAGVLFLSFNLFCSRQPPDIVEVSFYMHLPFHQHQLHQQSPLRLHQTVPTAFIVLFVANAPTVPLTHCAVCWVKFD